MTRLTFLILYLLFASVVWNVSKAFPAEILSDIPENKIIRCLMGEARGEPYKAIVAHAEAFRNRYARYGRIWGVDGCSFNGKEPSWVWAMVSKAWMESLHTNLVKGADHWHTDYIKDPYWTKGALMTAYIGKTKFYRGVK